ncbi:MAG: hypothetical protein ABJE95_35710 [Byssovorax sp.]
MKRARPSGLVRAGIAASLGLASAVLVPIACGVDTHPTAPPQVATSGGSGGAGGASGSTTASTGAGVGPDSVCACAVAAFEVGSACNDCFHQQAGVDCAAPVTACTSDDACVALIVALTSCGANAQCVADTLATHPARNEYLDVLACVCVSCAEACAGESTVKCDAGKIPIEAGNDADLEAETGSDAADDADDASADAADAMDGTNGMDAGDDAAMDAADDGG